MTWAPEERVGKALTRKPCPSSKLSEDLGGVS